MTELVSDWLAGWQGRESVKVMDTNDDGIVDEAEYLAAGGRYIAHGIAHR